MPFPILGRPRPAFFDSSGSPLVSGTLTIVEPSTDVAKATYPTYDDAVALTNANDNPITLNARGEVPSGFWGLDGEDYKITVKDSDGTTVYTDDDIFLPQYTTPATNHTIALTCTALSLSTTTPTGTYSGLAFSRDATVVEDFTLDASGSAGATNNNNVLAALIGELQRRGYID